MEERKGVSDRHLGGLGRATAATFVSLSYSHPLISSP